MPTPALWSFWALAALLAPLASAGVSLALPRLSRSGGIAICSMAGAFLACLGLAWEVFPSRSYTLSVPWIAFPGVDFSLGLTADPLSATLLALVTGITLLVMVFSTRYMEHDPGLHRYWSYLSFFSASMIGLILADSLLGIFICWELVGFSSWLLIGFWNDRPGPAAASQLAFLLNRTGDIAFLAGIMWLAAETGSTRITDLFAWAEAGGKEQLTGISLLLFGGALAKSAQFPLQIWLPNAMEGPTPVSALIHAATMVAAGVYLVIRVFPLFTPVSLAVVGSIGLITAMMAGLSALTQWDIKRLLAMSTLSQLGLMFVALGAGSPEMALFHLLTHAFMKCALFLVAGIVIHQYHHALGASDLPGFRTTGAHDIRLPLVQDMRIMGGLYRMMPIVFWASLLPMLSMAGFPLTAGYLSKEGILSAIFHQAGAGHMLAGWWLAGTLGVSALTAAYLARMAYLLFAGDNRLLLRMRFLPEGRFSDLAGHLLSPGPRMYLPVVLLGIGAVFFSFSPHPLHPEAAWAIGLIPGAEKRHEASLWLPLLAMFALFAGAWASYLQCRRPETIRFVRVGWLHRLLHHHFFQEKIYHWVVFRPLLAIGAGLRWWDERVVDGGVNLSARFLVTGRASWPHLAAFFGWWDTQVVDGVVRLVFVGFGRMGARIKGLQTGRVQWYLGIGVALLLLLAWIAGAALGV